MNTGGLDDAWDDKSTGLYAPGEKLSVCDGNHPERVECWDPHCWRKPMTATEVIARNDDIPIGEPPITTTAGEILNDVLRDIGHPELLHEPGVKDDAGKPMVADLMEFCSRAFEEMAKTADFGGRKYVPGGWLTVPDGFRRYTNAMQRHFLKERRGIRLDEEGQMHIVQVAVNAVYRLELFLREEEKRNA